MTLNNSKTNNIINPSNSTINTTSTKGNGNTQACAACKYQRRKCTPDCVLAPYFPHDRQRQFLNAHKLFGVSNITKIIKNLDQPDKDRAMHTIIFQSDLRANDPVGGCYRIIREYQRQIEYYKAELDIVLHQLAICRAQAHHHQPLQISESAGGGEPALNCEMMNVVDPLSLYTPMAMAAMQQPHYHCLQPQQDSYVSVVQNDHSNLQEDVSTWVIHDSELSLHTKQGLSEDHDHDCHEDIKPLLEVPCERNETKFETTQDIVERRFAPSPQLLTSS